MLLSLRNRESDERFSLCLFGRLLLDGAGVAHIWGYARIAKRASLAKEIGKHLAVRARDFLAHMDSISARRACSVPSRKIFTSSASPAGSVPSHFSGQVFAAISSRIRNSSSALMRS